MSLISFSERHRIEQKYIESIHSGASELQASIISSRILTEEAADIVHPTCPKITSTILKGIDKSINRVVRAISNDEMIYIAFDFEVESIASASLLYQAFTKFFNHSQNRIRMLPSNRIVDGFGFTSEFLERIKTTSPMPTLIVSVNQTTDIDAVAKDYSDIMKDAGSFGDVISVGAKRVTDDIPKSNVFSIINPNNKPETAGFHPSAGVTTMLFVLWVKEKLESKGVMGDIADMDTLFPLVLVGSLNESNRMTSSINRFMAKLVSQKMSSMVESTTLPPWIIAVSNLNKIPLPQLCNIESLKIVLTELIIAASLSEKNALLAAKFFITDRVENAARYLFILGKDNKSIEGKSNPIVTYIENAKKELAATPNVAITFTSQPALGVITQAANGILNELGCIAGVFTTYTVRQKHITPQYLEDNSIDMFKSMDDRVFIDLPDYEQIVVAKAIKTTLPTFELFSVFGSDIKKIKDLTLNEAVKLSPKKLFKGMSSTVHTVLTPSGTVCLDLTSWRKPKLYLNTIHDVRGVIRSPESISIKNILTSIQKKHPKIFSEMHGDGQLQNIQMRFDDLITLKKELSIEVDKIVDMNNLTIKPINYVDSLCDRRINTALLDEIIELEPFGDDFPEPTFHISGVINKVFSAKDKCQYRITCDNQGESLILTHHSEIINTKLVSGDEITAIVKIKRNIEGKSGVFLEAQSISIK